MVMDQHCAILTMVLAVGQKVYNGTAVVQFYMVQ